MAANTPGPLDIRRALILAAGTGSRIHPFSNGLPKPLVPLNGRPLVAYTLDALAANGIDDVAVVTGYREDMVRGALAAAGQARIEFVSNSRFEEGASTSLAAARDALGDAPFLLLMSDHVFAPDLVAQLLAGAATEGATVAADFGGHADHYVEEATKLDIEDGMVRAIGKSLECWQALDTGAFACTAATWDALDATPAGAELSAVFGIMAARGALHAADVTGRFWYDIDTPQDLAHAGAAFEAACGG
jgi:choline kinase